MAQAAQGDPWYTVVGVAGNTYQYDDTETEAPPWWSADAQPMPRGGRAAGSQCIVRTTARGLVMTRWIESLLIGVPRLDPASYLAATVLFGLIAFAACWIPARRATRVDPIVALRCD